MDVNGGRSDTGWLYQATVGTSSRQENLAKEYSLCTAISLEIRAELLYIYVCVSVAAYQDRLIEGYNI
jgi:hypothetical protein